MALHPVSQNEPRPSTGSLGEQKSSVSLLDLPCEVRLQIYHWVHLSSPVRQPQLTPWHPNPNPTSHATRAVVPNDHDGGPTTTRRRPFCRIPTALLQTCRQVHAEARAIPFQANGFVFVNLLSTGLSSALAFTRGRQPWQRAEMRFARLEVSARDVMAPGGSRFADWVQLCRFWSSGLRGLRLVVRTEEAGTYWEWDAGQERRRDGSKELRGLWEMVEGRTGTDWIRQGLGRLCGLRELEVELADVKWTGEDKVKWCVRLREMLVSSTGRMETNVVSVESIIDVVG